MPARRNMGIHTPIISSVNLTFCYKCVTVWLIGVLFIHPIRVFICSLQEQQRWGSLVGRCCNCTYITTGSTPLALDIDGNLHDRTPRTGVNDEWYVYTASPADYIYYRLRYEPSGGGGDWTPWLYFTSIIDVSTIPNPIGSGLFYLGGVHLPSQGLLPKSHFMRPTRIVGFSAYGLSPIPGGEIN